MSFENEQTNMEKIRCCQRIVEDIQAKNQQPVCHLQFNREPFNILDSHLGGIPYLPHNQKYPMGADGQMLWLCAQINFSQMPRMDEFPDEGILQIFLSEFNYDGGFGLYSEEDSTIQRQWRLLYYPSVDENVTEEECREKMPCSWEDGAKSWRTPDKPLKMMFLPIGQEKINHNDFRFDSFFASALTYCLPGANPKEYMPYGLRDDTSDERELLNKIRKQIEIGGCKIGGYPRYTQDDPRLYSEECGKPLEEWDTLLFQLDDDTFTFPAGDVGGMDFNLNGGTLNFLIRKEDLKNRDFSQVLAQWACS
ncbi:MAG: DUF1963 domain-containing protein [Lachnospiraceae bacterium]|nr:DUF1963 domain-containing protein [Lachnospiraceae bacterium]MBO5145852.1 DUF1963 domain-containing protein [Lachnospiraceae bacterium]